MEPVIVGIDGGLESVTVTVVNGRCERLVEPVSYANTLDGYEQLLANLESFSDDALLFCVENTGVYTETLCYFLDQRGYRVALVDPLRFSRTSRDPGDKNDKLDSGKIAEYGARYIDTLRLWRPNEEAVEQIRVLLRTREQLVKQRTALKNLLKSLKRKYIQTPTANQTVSETIDHLNEQIKHVEKEIGRIIAEHPVMAEAVTLVRSIKGVGLLLAAHVAVMTKGFALRLKYTSTAAYLGISPREYQSGKTVYRRPKSRQYGPAMMRKLLHLSARSLIISDPRHRQYYLRKQAEGKPRQLILNNIANKQLRVVCAVLHSGIPYSENYRSLNPRLLQKHLTKP